MTKDRICTIATYCVLGTACVVTYVLPDGLSVRTVSAQSVPDSYRLRGVVRDFLSTHPDFGLATTPSLSTIAGNVDPYLDPGGSPTTMSQAQSHGSNGMSTANVTISKWGMDGGGGTNVDDNKGGHDGTAMNGATRKKGIYGNAMEFDGVDDFVSVAHHADFLLDEGTVTFWFRADDTVATQGLVSKDSTGFDTGGHFTILLENNKVRWRLQTTTADGWVESPAGSVQPDTWHHVAASFGTAGMKLHLDNELVASDPAFTSGLGPSSGGIGNQEPWGFGVNTWVTGNLVTTGWIEPLAGRIDEVQIFTGQVADAEFNATGGYLVGNRWQNGSGDEIAPHVYGSAWCEDGKTPAPCFDASTDVAGTPGDTADSDITSPESFDDWFTDIIGVNMSTQHTIDMVKDMSGVYEFSDLAFDPVRGRLLGNEGNSINANFTYAIEATFTYEQCTGQFVEFQGGDGAWLYLDGRLALDMGGIAANNHQLIELDRLCLQDGQDYSFHFFYANRQATASEFTLRTNIWLRQSPGQLLMVTQPFD